jgi:hypothetical protein
MTIRLSGPRYVLHLVGLLLDLHTAHVLTETNPRVYRIVTSAARRIYIFTLRALRARSLHAHSLSFRRIFRLVRGTRSLRRCTQYDIVDSILGHIPFIDLDRAHQHALRETRRYHKTYLFQVPYHCT